MTDQSITPRRASDDIVTDLLPSRLFGDEELAGIKTAEEALALVREVFGGITPAEEVLGNGFSILDSDKKGQLVGVPLLLVEWRFNDGEQGKFVSINAVAIQEGGNIRKLIVNDGSTGLMEQLAAYTNRTGLFGGLLVKKGLKESRYKFTDENGDKKDASTFYLDTSA